ncbi:ribonuclease E inhibitor RraB [Hymenobacter properus]|uniref:Ribonuclease E inhibitor RraB n=1 Tax=Hymenobacter properus TaxID=2791026 RepID=A0A931FMR7_9BACT|nr:ribonuclease E inhibitor RraB [Hymenobacter properus]MBF9143371.1 ribonuclease E inhibitor RraB [Hymenobacter properus]MBR7722182.1 ribonuclease E inhibitor RraB [Microvirga sp. SRT04]
MNASFDSVKEMFRKMEANGWDTASTLKWGFFFSDKDKGKLLDVFSELEEHSYKNEGMHQADDGDWVLQVSKLDILTPEKLHKRNVAFNELAAHCAVELYDGWDVGKIE